MAKAEGAGGRSSDIVMLPNREKTRSLSSCTSLPPVCDTVAGTGLLCCAAQQVAQPAARTYVCDIRRPSHLPTIEPAFEVSRARGRDVQQRVYVPFPSQAWCVEQQM